MYFVNCMTPNRALERREFQGESKVEEVRKADSDPPEKPYIA